MSLAGTATSIILSSQKYACLEKIMSRQKTFRERERNILSRETELCRENNCHDKHTFDATKMVLVAAPASDNERGLLRTQTNTIDKKGAAADINI